MSYRSAAGGLPHPSAVRVQVLAACAQLGALADSWEPAGALCEDARLALAGESGLTAGQLARLRLWGTRWQQVDPRLRHLLARHAEKVGAALWHLLDAQNTPASGALYGTLRDLWVAEFGYPPSIELLPTHSTHKATQ